MASEDAHRVKYSDKISDKSCKSCSRNTKSTIKCVICAALFHPSCATRIVGLKVVGRDEIVCPDCTLPADRQMPPDVYFQLMTQLVMELREKNDILVDKNRLLEENLFLKTKLLEFEVSRFPAPSVSTVTLSSTDVTAVAGDIPMTLSLTDVTAAAGDIPVSGNTEVISDLNVAVDGRDRFLGSVGLTYAPDLRDSDQRDPSLLSLSTSTCKNVDSLLKSKSVNSARPVASVVESDANCDGVPGDVSSRCKGETDAGVRHGGAQGNAGVSGQNMDTFMLSQVQSALSGAHISASTAGKASRGRVKNGSLQGRTRTGGRHDVDDGFGRGCPCDGGREDDAMDRVSRAVSQRGGLARPLSRGDDGQNLSAVANGRRTAKRVQRFGTGSAGGGLEAFVPLSSIHVSKVKLSFAGVDVIKFVKTKLGQDVLVDCEELEVRSQSYRSFRISVPADQGTRLLDTDFWPPGIAVRKFINYRARRSSSGGPSNVAVGNAV